MVSVGLLLFGCARESTVPSERHARQALGKTGEAVLLVLEGNPFAMDQARLNALVASEMAEGVKGMNVQFTTSPDRAGAAEPHLVVVLNPLSEPGASALCTAPRDIPTEPAGERMRVIAAFCERDRPLGVSRTEDAVSSPTDHRFRRMLWRTSAELFPDDYLETYGFGILPRSIDLGIGGSLGGGSIGK
jgi:hypothetical protein